MNPFLQQFTTALSATSLPEWIAVIAGILSVWLSRRESVWLYPVGLINTVVYIWLSYKYSLLGEAVVNLYYTVMSLWGWWFWLQRRVEGGEVKTGLRISHSSREEGLQQLLFFAILLAGFFAALRWLKGWFYPGVMPFPDALATASAFTGMWLMVRKKVESWYWWLLTNAVSMPLYFVKGLALTSVYYLVLFGLAISGLLEWRRRAAIVAEMERKFDFE